MREYFLCLIIMTSTLSQWYIQRCISTDIGENSYHWAFLVGPKNERDESRGTRYHAKEALEPGRGSTWSYEEIDISLDATKMILVRILIAKVEDKTRLAQILRDTPIRDPSTGWNCVEWVREALKSLAEDSRALGTQVTEWETVRNQTLAYCQRKKDTHRFDGKAKFDMSKVPTYDLITEQETVA